MTASATDRARAGRLVRTLSAVSPGVRAIKDQIPSFAAAWEERNEVELASGRPLWVALGDSLTQGIGAPTIEQSYAARLQRRCHEAGWPLALVNLSRSGARIEDVRRSQLPTLVSLATDHSRPVLVTCTIGSNDLLRSARLGRARQQARELIAALPDRTVMATLPAAGSLAAAGANRFLRETIRAHGHDIADVASYYRPRRGTIARDHFHPNEHGYQAWVAAFTEALAGRI